jgi:hypothetical protein
LLDIRHGLFVLLVSANWISLEYFVTEHTIYSWFYSLAFFDYDQHAVTAKLSKENKVPSTFGKLECFPDIYLEHIPTSHNNAIPEANVVTNLFEKLAATKDELLRTKIVC